MIKKVVLVSCIGDTNLKLYLRRGEALRVTLVSDAKLDKLVYEKVYGVGEEF